MKTALLLFCLVLSLVSSKMFHNKFEELLQEKLVDRYAESQEYIQRVDHFNPQNKETFSQRFFDINQYWDPETGPLILYICGESICGAPSPDSFVVELAKKFKGRVLALEHRYYGQSQPKPDWSTENLQFLSPDQGLADLAQFATDKSREFSEEHGIPIRRWITVGGSYPGALSAWFRAKYPHIAFASLASSAVVEAIADYHQYDGQVYKSTLKSGEECPNKYIRMNAAFEEAIEQGKGEEILYRIGLNPDDYTPKQFLGLMGNLAAGTIQYGGRRMFCSLLEGVEDTLDDYIDYVKRQVNPFGLELKDFLIEERSKEVIDPNSWYRQWGYQTCTKLGWFQTYSQDTPAMRSQQVDIEYWRDNCKREFGVDLFPNIDHWNDLYGGKELIASKIIFTNGGEDPWQHASITESDNPTFHTFVIDCDDCAHCVDLIGGSAAPELVHARSEITSILGEWIEDELSHESKYPSESSIILRESA